MGNIKVNTLNNNTINVQTNLNDISVDDANGIYIIMSMYNLIIFDTSGKL